jgi:hypothetical protein
MPPNQPPKKRGGRPRIHASREAAAQAKKEGNRRWYERSLQPAGPADFIAYEPALHSNVPADTPPEIGLRTNIPIPPGPDAQRNNAQQSDILQSAHPNPPQPTSLPTLDQDAEIARQIMQIQIEEQESNLQRDEYEAEISQQLTEIDTRTAEILMGMRSANATSAAEETNTGETGGLQAMGGSNTVGEGEGVCNEGLQRSCSSQVASVDEPIMTWDNDSIAASNTSNRPASIQRSPENTVPLQTPTQHRSPPLPSSNRTSSKGSTSRRSTSFPAQNNNLLSWMKPLARRSPTNSTSSPPATEGPPSDAPSSPFRRIESIAPSSLAESVICTTPAPAIPTPTPARTPGATASPDVAAPDAAASPAPTERTTFKLAKQLRNFQGCTHEQHRKADQSHQEHHRRPDVHSKCSSLQHISDILRGNHRDTPLPDVLSSAKLMKPMDFGGLDCQAAFEGTSTWAAPEDIGTRDEKLPMNLCLSQQYDTSRKNRRAKVSFDIDSTCCFPTSLAIARQGINWFPKVHPFLNLSADIHFGLKVPSYNNRGVLTRKFAPLHKIPHYCFGSVIGMEGLLIFVFFPALHAESDYEHSTYLSKQDQELWYDAILSPAINKTIQSSNILQHYPATARIASIDSTALSAESLARKDSSREQLLRYALQPQYLDALWNLVLHTIAENPGYHRFQGATLFMHAKNTKLESMNVTGDLTAAYEGWEQSWSQTTDPQFYNKDRTFIDLAKQTTSEDSALPYDQIPEDHDAEVFLWKKCCLDAYARTRTVLDADGSPAKGSPKRTTYPWAAMRDTMGQTFFAAPQGKECQDGLIYSQFYALIKTPFDTSKVYVFDNDALENLALDPGYIRSLQQEGGGIAFSKGVCEFGYLHSKKRAHANLVDNRWKSYGIREEHRISLTMMEEIYQQWRQWDLYDDEIDATPPPLPYYIVPTKELLGFLYAQINKYCFLFEHVLGHTAMTYSLPETILMVTALRALRFCYGSNLIQRESLLYKDRWESLRSEKPVVKEGLGMRDTMKRCGLGWFLPKINWATWRFAPPHGENILVGNVLMHEEYKRRWRAVKDLRDVYIRFNQAESWYDRYNVQHSTALLGKWLEYLHALNLEQFDADIWKAMLKSHKRSPELTSDAIKQKGDIQFCQNHMKRMFSVDGAIGLPHFVTGNKMRFERVTDLLNFLFLWEDGKERRGWGSKPYRAILQKSFELIERRLGYRRADKWLNEFFYLVRLTHWVLPYPSHSTLIMSTKTSRNQGLKGRMMWFSAVYADPEKVELPFRSHPITLYGILWNARRQTFGDGRHQNAWDTSQLIAACSAQGLKVHGQEETEGFWVAGKRSIGLKGFVPVWERMQPPRLKMLEQTKNQSLDELEDLMGGFSREYADDDIQDDRSDIGSNDPGVEVGVNERDSGGNRQSRSARIGRSIMAAFARTSHDERSRGSQWDESVTAMTVSSGSVFAPSGGEG